MKLCEMIEQKLLLVVGRKYRNFEIIPLALTVSLSNVVHCIFEMKSLQLLSNHSLYMAVYTSSND